MKKQIYDEKNGLSYTLPVSYTHLDVYKRQALYRMLEIKSTIISEMEKIQPRCRLTISGMSIYTKHTEIDKTLC